MKNSGPINILLVDDDPITNRLNKIIIEKSGIEFIARNALNGKEALELISGSQDSPKFIPDLILLDINMPVMDGWEFIEKYTKIRSPQQSDTTIAVLTTSLNPEHRNKAGDIAIIDHFLQKPLNINALKRILKISN